MTNNTHVLRVSAPGSTRWGWLNHINVCTNLPVCKGKAKALALTEETARTISGNLRNRGWETLVLPVGAPTPRSIFAFAPGFTIDTKIRRKPPGRKGLTAGTGSAILWTWRRHQ